MNDAQIKHMVDRFLSWKLPDNFSPDAGISFDPPVTWPWPTGTNLFDATQVDAMVRHMGDGLLVAQTMAACDVLTERERQVCEEGWTAQHDDRSTDGSLAKAAACYTAFGVWTHEDRSDGVGPPYGWPWPRNWWKPKNRRRDLVRAAALILAEIERLDRAGATDGGNGRKPDRHSSMNTRSSATCRPKKSSASAARRFTRQSRSRSGVPNIGLRRRWIITSATTTCSPSAAMESTFTPSASPTRIDATMRRSLMTRTMRRLIGEVIWDWTRRWRAPPAPIAELQAELARLRNSHKRRRSIVEEIKATRTALLRMEVNGT